MTLNPATLSGIRNWVRAKDYTAGAVAATVDQGPLALHGTASGTVTCVAAQTPGGGKTLRFGGAGFILLPTNAAPGRGKANAIGPWSASPTLYTADNLIDNGQNGITNGETWAYDSVPAWWSLELPTPQVVTSYRIMGASQYPTAWTWEGSNDGSTWNVLDTRTGQTMTAGTFTSPYAYTNITAYRFYKINVTARAGSPLHIVEIQLDSVSNGTPGEVWAVVKDTTAAGTNNPHWLDFSEVDFGYYPFSDGTVYDTNGCRARQFFTPTVTTKGWRLYRLVHNGNTSWQVYFDNVSQKTASVVSTWKKDPRIGSHAASGNAVADVAEWLVRDVVSTSPEVSWLIDYFNTEHGLTVPGGASPVVATDFTGWGIPI